MGKIYKIDMGPGRGAVNIDDLTVAELREALINNMEALLAGDIDQHPEKLKPMDPVWLQGAQAMAEDIRQRERLMETAKKLVEEKPELYRALAESEREDAVARNLDKLADNPPEPTERFKRAAAETRRLYYLANWMTYAIPVKDTGETWCERHRDGIVVVADDGRVINAQLNELYVDPHCRERAKKNPG